VSSSRDFRASRQMHDTPSGALPPRPARLLRSHAQPSTSQRNTCWMELDRPSQSGPLLSTQYSGFGRVASRQPDRRSKK